ncbi:serine hydrolase [Fructilactobacillus vespulae]|uniref:D-alanyl-D-alanine carboxypeptidase family protein n=1 Tax=Fructilactobacillus vespulae TaxID=1249630 RepID=UPI0039B5C3E0
MKFSFKRKKKYNPHLDTSHQLKIFKIIEENRLISWVALGTIILISLGIWGGVTYHRENSQQVAKTAKKIPEPKVKPIPLTVPTKHAIVIDAKTGQVLGEKDSDTLVGIASQSKMLTSYQVLKRIKSGKLHWDDKVQIDKKEDWSKKNNDTYAHLDMHEGQSISVKDLFNAMYTNSANDAALALADYLTPKNMTQQQVLKKWAKELHLKGSTWYNAAGQVNEDAFDYQIKKDPAKAENLATARQLAILAKKNIDLYPEIRNLYVNGEKTLYYHPEPGDEKMRRTEYARLKEDILPHLKNPLDLTFEGLKTGSTPNSGGAFTGLMKDKTGREYITVVSGSGAYTNRSQRYQDTIDVVNEVILKGKQLNK